MSQATWAAAHNAGRMPLIDALKGVGAQLIVLHHLAFYGPMSDWTALLWPDVVGWFSQHARMAVQLFLVMGGFLAARSLAADGVLRREAFAQQVVQRYVRVVLPMLAALLVGALCAKVAGLWMVHDSLPTPTEGTDTVVRWIGHALLLQDVLALEALSAGVWYVAIDFQLYVLLLAVLWCARRTQHPKVVGSALVLVLMVLAWFGFNRSANWDVLALYFFGSYGLGVLTYWATRAAPEVSAATRWAWAALGLLVLTALAVDFRTRLLLAWGVAVWLGVAQWRGWLHQWPNSRLLGYMGQISYSVFLLNFPVALVVNAWFTHYMPASVAWQTLGVLVAWLLCNVAGAVFHHTVEQRLARWDFQRCARACWAHVRPAP